MKTSIALFSAILCSATFAATTLGGDAIDMTRVLTHPDVRTCVEDFNASQMINVKVEKTVYRCPGCNTYKITGTELNIDIPGRARALNVVGKAVPGFGGGFVQTYTCTVE